MCEIAAFGDFHGLWEEGKAGWFDRPVFQAFHRAGISTALSPLGNSKFQHSLGS